MRYFESREFGNGDVNADYADVTFQLKVKEPAPGPVYVLGALSDWQLKEAFRLTYDEATQLYTGRALLKQGSYHYYYALSTGATTPPNCAYFEGSHYETENQYDLLVYYRPPGTRTDLIIRLPGAGPEQPAVAAGHNLSRGATFDGAETNN